MFFSVKSAKLGILLLTFGFVFPNISFAQEPPSAEYISGVISETLPSFWQIDSYVEIAAANNNDPVAPEIAVRFETVVSNKAQLFLKTDEVAGPFTVVLNALNEGTARTLYGTIVLRYNAGAWIGQPVIENPINGLGQPIDLFIDPTVTLGSADYVELLIKLRDNTVDVSNAKLAEEIAGLSRAYADEANDLKAVHQQSIDDLNSANNDVIANLTSELEEAKSDFADRAAALEVSAETAIRERAVEIARLTTEYADDVSNLTAAHQQTVNDLNSEHRQILSDMDAELDLQRSVLNTARIAELTQNNRRHAVTKGELIASMEQELAALEMGFSVRLEKFAEMSADSEDTLALQDRLIEARQMMLDNENWLLQLNIEHGLARKELVASLKGTWTGLVTCRDYGNESHAIEINLAEFTGGNLAGEITVNGGSFFQSNNRSPYDGVLVVQGDSGIHPVKVSFNAGERYLNYELSLTETGTLTGHVSENDQCEVYLSR